MIETIVVLIPVVEGEIPANEEEVVGRLARNPLEVDAEEHEWDDVVAQAPNSDPTCIDEESESEYDCFKAWFETNFVQALVLYGRRPLRVL